MNNYQETGVFNKPFNNRVKIALVYPNLYKVGMSSLGFQTVYRMLNEKTFITCDRVFLPEKNGIEPRSLENNKRLSEYDFVLFSISYSTDILNVLKILKSSSITLSREDRAKFKSPIIGAGGTAVFINPEPLAPISDFLFLGEGESFLEEFSDILDKNSSAVKERNSFLNAIREIQGVYIPEDIEIEYDRNGKITKFNAKYPDIKIARAYAADINEFQTHSALFTRDAEFGEIFMEEISRGCARGCRFCAIGFVGRPFRTRKIENLKLKGEKSGFKIGILGAAISDHPQIKEIARTLISLQDKISFSSFRVDKIDSDIVNILKDAKIKTFTIAPEAGSDRLRKIIGKGISEELILESTKALVEAGINNLKLYFMIGLPYEKFEDIQAITDLCTKISLQSKNMAVNVSINPFIPKPFTPFQWLPLASKEYIKKTSLFLKKSLLRNKIKVKVMPFKSAFLDAVLSKGDRKLGESLIFSFDNSLHAVDEILNLEDSPKSYVYRLIDIGETLPWDFIDNRIEKSLLISEFKKAKAVY